MPLTSLARHVGPRVLALLFAGATERVCYAAVTVFLPAYRLTRYSIDGRVPRERARLLIARSEQ